MTNIDRKERKKVKSGKKRGKKVIAVILAVIVVAVNIACYKFENIITLFLEDSEVASEEELERVTANAEETSVIIESEGAVLLKNENNVLPMESRTINIFGWGSVSPIYAGTGSGGGNSDDNITVQQGLEDAGFTVNDELTQFYEDLDFERKNAGPLTGFQPDLHLYEAELTDYPDELLADAASFSDTAVVVISRPGGEASDLETDMSELDGDEGRNMLELTSQEEDLFQMVTDTYENVIVLINAANAMELGFLEDDGIDAALWIGDPGRTGFEAVGQILSGEVNPSGALVDTYPYDATSAPSYANFGDFTYSNSENVHYVEYAEGIYVGYRYYETRYVDNETGVCNEEAYRDAVQYPFGFGLSYTDFSQMITSFDVDDQNVTVQVEVENTGDTAGKDIVQIYCTPPYEAGGIEKSHVVLAGFDKTELLDPGEKQTMTIEIPIEELASYDYINEKAYVLDEGTYGIKLMDNAHDLIDSRSFQVDERVIYDTDNSRSTDEIAATNLFDDVAGDVTYVSRADWEGTLPQNVAREKEADSEILNQIEDTGYEVNENDEDIIVKDNGLTLQDMKDLDYDDEKWDQLLEQLSVEDMRNLIGKGGYQTIDLKSINKGKTSDVDGPAGINAIVNGVSAVTYTTEVVLASTWNTNLAYAMGEALAQEADAYSVDGIYAPAMNIHRSPFGGRNFEYYSEDPYLSGKMGAAEVLAIRDNGKYCYLKHFALNDQETNRNGVATWANEQSMREIYFRPFEYAVKEGSATAVMSAFNRLGTTWCGARSELLQTVLRDEWGFHGMVITDYDGMSYMNVDQAIRAGNDIMLSTTGDLPTDTSNTAKQAMRSASHNILYTVANSVAVNYTYEFEMPTWAIILIVADIVIVLLYAAVIIRSKKMKKK